MDFFSRNAVGVVALVVAIIGCYLPISSAVQQNFGGITNYDEVDATAIRIGAGCGSGGSSCAGTRLGGVYAGSCSLIANTFTVTASTTKAMDCAIAGLVSGDGVEIMFATSTAAGTGWSVVGASASSTSGFATIRVANNTGADAVIPASIASSTVYEAFHILSSAPGL